MFAARLRRCELTGTVFVEFLADDEVVGWLDLTPIAEWDFDRGGPAAGCAGTA